MEPMKKFQPTLEHALYALALVIAAGLRFLHLGALPLSDYEATWALQALRIVQGLRPGIGPNPAYVHLTAILFFIFGTTNFLARFWPALAGCALVLAPWFLRGRFGRLAALAVAFGLAIDPGLVAMSHLAGGPMLAITLLVFTGLMWMEKRPVLAGVLAGLALLSGPSIWFGILGLVLAWAFAANIGKKVPAPVEETGGKAKRKPAAPEAPAKAAGPGRFFTDELRAALLWGVGTLLVGGTLFLLSPKGLSGFGASAWASLSGWWTVSDTQFWQPLLALPAYEILPLGFGIAGAVRGILKRDADSLRLAIWALVAFVLSLIYPGKQVSDLVWALLPLWALAGLELSHHFDFAGQNMWEFSATFALVIAVLVFGWLKLADLTTVDLSASTSRINIYILPAFLLLIFMALALAWTGWSRAIARLAGVWSFTVALTAFTVAMATGSAGLRQPLTAELWLPEPRTSRVDVLLKVASQISDLNRGYAEQLPLTILQVDSPALHWVFRDWKVQDVSDLAPDATPELLITPPGNVSLAVKYRGEGLPLYEHITWDQATASDWLKWIIYRQAPIARDDIILWVRADLMLDDQSTQPTP